MIVDFLSWMSCLTRHIKFNNIFFRSLSLNSHLTKSRKSEDELIPLFPEKKIAPMRNEGKYNRKGPRGMMVSCCLILSELLLREWFKLKENGTSRVKVSFCRDVFGSDEKGGVDLFLYFLFFVFVSVDLLENMNEEMWMRRRSCKIFTVVLMSCQKCTKVFRTFPTFPEFWRRVKQV